MNHFEEILRQGQSLLHQHFHENEELYDKSTNQSNLMSTAVEQMHSPFDSSPKASMFFFSLNSPRQNADNFHFNQQNLYNKNNWKQHIQPIARRLEFQEDQSLFCQEEELEQEEHSAKQQEQWNFESSSSPGKNKKIKKSKNSKGLKNLSIGVYQIVAEKSQTTYKQVANTLIQKLSRRAKQESAINFGYESFCKLQKDEHNIKRRVYDALNVLISAELLRKEGKRVICNYNLQRESSNKLFLESQRAKAVENIEMKQQMIAQKRHKLEQLRQKYQKLQFLINKNKQLGPRPSSRVINLPFIIARSNTEDIQTVSIGHGDIEIKYSGNVLIMGDVDTIEEML